MQVAVVVVDMQVVVAVVQLDRVVQVAVVQEQQEQLQQPLEIQTPGEAEADLVAERQATTGPVPAAAPVS